MDQFFVASGRICTWSFDLFPSDYRYRTGMFNLSFCQFHSAPNAFSFQPTDARAGPEIAKLSFDEFGKAWLI